MKRESIVSAHPVAPEMRAQILDCLVDLERRDDVTVLFACESGSRGWGFASPDGDYDVRSIYVNRLDWYLSVEPRRDVIEQPISGDLDVNGLDLRKALQLLRKSNPILLEWLRSPIVYREETDTVARLRMLAEQGFSAVRGYHHYVSMAKKNFREHLRGEEVRYKKFLYVMRPLLAARWIREDRGVPPMRFAELAEATLDDRVLLVEVNRLLEVKMRAGEAATSPRWDGLHAFIETELAVAMAHVVKDATQLDTTALDAFLSGTAHRYEKH
ncbi:MAG: nucleotidyltransferase domain-containing protein [Burkholderiales bacterium]